MEHFARKDRHQHRVRQTEDTHNGLHENDGTENAVVTDVPERFERCVTERWMILGGDVRRHSHRCITGNHRQKRQPIQEKATVHTDMRDEHPG